jgi:hypothetical protein
MPAISTLTVCANVPGENTFTNSNAGFVAQDPPAWFNLEIVAIDIITGSLMSLSVHILYTWMRRILIT